MDVAKREVSILLTIRDTASQALEAASDAMQEAAVRYRERLERRREHESRIKAMLRLKLAGVENARLEYMRRLRVRLAADTNGAHDDT